VALALTLPSGEERRGTLRAHGLTRDALAEGETLTLWFDAGCTTFLLEDPPLPCGPGRVLPPRR